MSGLFSRPKVQQTIVKAPEPTPVPTYDDAADREEFSRKVRRRRGHLANVRSSGGSTPSVAARELLG